MTSIQKRERMEKRYYKLIADGKYEEANKMMQKIVDFDVEYRKKYMNK